MVVRLSHFAEVRFQVRASSTNDSPTPHFLSARQLLLSLLVVLQQRRVCCAHDRRLLGDETDVLAWHRDVQYRPLRGRCRRGCRYTRCSPPSPCSSAAGTTMHVGRPSVVNCAATPARFAASCSTITLARRTPEEHDVRVHRRVAERRIQDDARRCGKPRNTRHFFHSHVADGRSSTRACRSVRARAARAARCCACRSRWGSCNGLRPPCRRCARRTRASRSCSPDGSTPSNFSTSGGGAVEK